jgi:hypothetical protein
MAAHVQVQSAEMLAIDRLGMDTRAVPAKSPEQGPVSVRIAFTSPAEDRKAVKERLVELTRTAAAAQKEVPTKAADGES